MYLKSKGGNLWKQLVFFFTRTSILHQMFGLLLCNDIYTCICNFLLYEIESTVKPVLSDHIKQYIFLCVFFFQTGGCLLLHESSAESSGAFCTTFIQQ